MSLRPRTAPAPPGPGPAGRLLIGALAGILSILACVFLTPSPLRAQSPGEASRPSQGGGAGEEPVNLDRLLTLPDAHEYTVERRGGQTEGEWRQRFHELREALQREREGLADAEQRMDELARDTSAWKVAPALPGVASAADEAPLDYGLRREIQRHREEIQRLERKIRELEVEADLAGVPAAWREAGARRRPPAPEQGRAAEGAR